MLRSVESVRELRSALGPNSGPMRLLEVLLLGIPPRAEKESLEAQHATLFFLLIPSPRSETARCNGQVQSILPQEVKQGPSCDIVILPFVHVRLKKARLVDGVRRVLPRQDSDMYSETSRHVETQTSFEAKNRYDQSKRQAGLRSRSSSLYAQTKTHPPSTFSLPKYRQLARFEIRPSHHLIQKSGVSCISRGLGGLLSCCACTGPAKTLALLTNEPVLQDADCF